MAPPRRQNQNKPKQNNGPRRQGQLMQRATRDVQLSAQPSLDYFNRATQGINSAYGGLAEQLAPLDQQYTRQSNQIAGNLTDQLGNLATTLGLSNMTNLPASEQQAGLGYYGTLGAGGQELLASQAQRNLGYISSAQREQGLAQRAALGNIMQQQLDLTSQFPTEIRSRIDELRQQRLENQLAKSSMQGDDAFRQFLISQIGGIQKNENRRQHNRRGGNKNKGGGGSPHPVDNRQHNRRDVVSNKPLP